MRSLFDFWKYEYIMNNNDIIFTNDKPVQIKIKLKPQWVEEDDDDCDD